MCSYKLVTVKFEVWGLQTRVEQFVHKVRKERFMCDFFSFCLTNFLTGVDGCQSQRHFIFCSENIWQTNQLAVNQCSIIALYNICPLRFLQIALHHLPLPGLNSLNFIFHIKPPISKIPFATTASVPEVNRPRPLLARGTHIQAGSLLTQYRREWLIFITFLQGVKGNI